MKTYLLAIVALALSACGPGFSFEGQFSGNGSAVINCPDGSSLANAVAPVWTITETGSTLNISTNGGCSPLSATSQGSTAALAPKSCPPQFNADGDRLVESIDTGTLTLSKEGNLSVSIRGKATFTFLSQPGQPVFVCQEIVTAQLIRVE